MTRHVYILYPIHAVSTPCPIHAVSTPYPIHAVSTPYPTDYGDYYDDDEDVLGHHGAGEDAAGMETDATFQHDPEHHWFSCLSEEETWNFLDKLVKATAQDLKVGQADSLNDSMICGDVWMIMPIVHVQCTLCGVCCL